MPATDSISNSDSILNSIKKLIGLDQDYTEFDTDLIIHINSVFLDLEQLGAGSQDGFFIEGSTETWEDFLPDDPLVLNSIKSYMYLKVKKLFDPPTSSSAMDSLNSLIDRFEWRINVAIENKDST